MGLDLTRAAVYELAAMQHRLVLQNSTNPATAAIGDGSLELARGTQHVSFVDADGVEHLLSGEVDATGAPWDSTVWRDAEWSGVVWRDEQWSSVVWRSGSWAGHLWTSRGWAGGAWQGTIWKGVVWRSNGWQLAG